VLEFAQQLGDAVGERVPVAIVDQQRQRALARRPTGLGQGK
jgi:hypothetical protein